MELKDLKNVMGEESLLIDSFAAHHFDPRTVGACGRNHEFASKFQYLHLVTRLPD